MKSVEELRKLSISELTNELLEVRKQQFNMRMRKALDSLEKTHLQRQCRRSIAKIKTIITEKSGKDYGNE
ncbi:MAG: 50S ribosomal protein L29 [Legionella sp.]|nr:50S ribosomal protein L29 [Legionella sp.]